MAITLLTPLNSFVRFGEADSNGVCGWENIDFNLPVYAEDDVSFQVIANADSPEEADFLCQPGATEVSVSLVADCDALGTLIDFSEKPDRFRLSPTQILYNWERGFPGWPGPIQVSQCFKIRIALEGQQFCSNTFERIIDPCYTSVLEFSNNEDAFGYKYCYGGGVGNEDVDTTCEPTTIQFINQATLTIPYTASLQSKYGQMPTVQAWIYDENNQLVNMGVTAKFDAFPPTQLFFDFGGPATGIIVIR